MTAPLHVHTRVRVCEWGQLQPGRGGHMGVEGARLGSVLVPSRST